MNTTYRTLLCIAVAAVLLIPTVSTAQTKAPPGPLDKQFDRYWAGKRSVRNIHKRLFLKQGRFEFALTAGVIPNDDFFTYYPVGGRFDYYFSEDLAVEVAGSYMVKNDSELKSFLESELLPGIAIDANLPQFLEWQAGAGVLWTPLHGKVAFFDAKLGHFDFGLYLGVMALGTQVTEETQDASTGRVDVGGTAGATVRFYLLDFLALRFDYRHYFYAARDSSDESRGLSYPAELSLGVSFFTSAPN